MKNHLVIALFAIFFSGCMLSQNNAAPNSPKKKEHYRIINNGSDDPLWYEKAMQHAQGMDSLRFLNERRHIPVKGTTLVLELFSAQELQDNYGKPISLLTIKDPAKARKVSIKLNSKNMIEVIAE